MVSPGADAVDRLYHAQMRHVTGAPGQKVFAGGIACGWRMRRQGEATREACLQESFDAIQVLQN